MSHSNNNTPQDLRKFGIIMAAGIIAVFNIIIPLLKEKTVFPIGMLPLYIAGLFLLAAVFLPRILKPVYRVWMRIGFVLGWINTRIILTVIFAVIFIPVGFIFRIMKKDPLQRGWDEDASSYRQIITAKQPSHMEKPF